MESLAGGSATRLAPLWEFRDLGNANGGNLPAVLKSAEDTLVAFHKTFRTAPIKARVAAPAKSSSAPSCARTSSSSSSASRSASKTSAGPSATSASATKASASPSATSDPKKKGKCSEGQILDPAEGGQAEKTEKPVCVTDKKCPEGQVADTAAKETKCGKDLADDKKPKCDTTKEYSAITVDTDGNAIYKCTKTRKTVSDEKKAAEDKKAADDKKAAEAKKAAEDKKVADEKKAADNKVKEAKRGRVSFCMAFVAGSGLIGKDDVPSDDILNVSADDWPADSKWVEGKHSSSFILKSIMLTNNCQAF